MDRLLSPQEHAGLQSRGISRNVDPSSLKIPRRSYPGGFGRDLPPDIGQAWLTALAKRPPRRLNDWWTERLNLNDHAIDAWNSSVQNSYGHGRIPIEETRFHEVVHQVPRLRVESVYQDLTLNQIGFAARDPSDVSFPALPVIRRWRHYPFAAGLFAPGIVHLPTIEMERPTEVWNRLNELFRHYVTLRLGPSWQTLPLRLQQRELLDLYLALYERILVLWYQARIKVLHYTQTISQREPHPTPAEDTILGMPGQALMPDRVSSAQQYRTRIYHELLMWLLNQTVYKLSQ